MVHQMDHFPSMKISVSDAKKRLTALVRKAEAGADIVLTRHGHDAVRLVAVKSSPSAEFRTELLDSLRRSASSRARQEPGAARSQDFLYGDDGIPA